MTESVHLILVPTDFSQRSCEAFSWAATLAKQFESKILILHVISEDLANKMVSIPGEPWERVLEKEGKLMVELFNSCLLSEFGTDLNIESLTAVGPTHAKILEVAKERNVSVIVMTTHGKTGLAHLVMGSVAENIMRSASCPVFIVRPQNLK